MTLRITHTRDLFFSRFNNVKAYKQREDGSEYDYAHMKTSHDTAALKFIHHLIDTAMFDKCDIKYELEFIRDCE